MLLDFSFFHLVGICPVERVNCPPVRAEPGVIRRNVQSPKSAFIHLADFRSSWILGSREAAIPASFDLAERALEGEARDRTPFYQVGSQRVKHKFLDI
jgi:hypothetical protein